MLPCFLKFMTLAKKNDLLQLLDSGAIHHLTSDKAHLTDVTPYIGYEGIVIGNDSLFLISQINVGELDLNIHKLL